MNDDVFNKRNASLRGKSVFPTNGTWPTFGKQVLIAPGARVYGQANLAEGCSLWFNAVIRADVNTVDIGPNTNIQDNAVIHVAEPAFPVRIGREVTIGHGAILHGCTIGNQVLIGMGAIVLDGAIIGDGSVIGAGSLIRQGMEVPPGSLVVGSPGRVIKTLNDKEKAQVSGSAAQYVTQAEVLLQSLIDAEQADQST